MSATNDQTSIAAPNATGTLSGKRIGATSRRVVIRVQPSATAPTIGLLTAGARVLRSAEPVGVEGCAGGWFAVEPRGFVCLDEQTTLDESHPTLVARSLKANPEATLPYPYAIARTQVPLFAPDPDHRDGVTERGRLKKGSTFAVVGTWDTLDDYDQRQRLAMLTLGSFVPKRDIEPFRNLTTPGFCLDEAPRFPVGLARSTKTPWYRLAGGTPVQGGFLSEREPIALTVKSRSLEGVRYLQLTNDTFVAESDVVVLKQRLEFPQFVTPSTHWVDVDLEHGTILLYIGERPSYVARTKSRPNSGFSRGSSWVKSKHITDLTSKPAATVRTPIVEDLPWLVELENGVTLRAAVGGPDSEAATEAGLIELGPEDAAKLFRFLAPSVPTDWHAVVTLAPRREGSPILFR